MPASSFAIGTAVAVTLGIRILASFRDGVDYAFDAVGRVFSANWRTVQSTLKAMQQLSRAVLFSTVPGTQRRKRLGKRVLGII